MTKKTRRTVSLPQELDDYLSRDGTNASELVAKLVEQHMQGGASQDQILEFRIDQVENELADVEGKYERKKRELQELKERRQQYQQTKQQEQKEQQEEQLEQVIQQVDVIDLSSMDEPVVDATDDQLKEHATELGLSVEELRDKIIAESDF